MPAIDLIDSNVFSENAVYQFQFLRFEIASMKKVEGFNIYSQSKFNLETYLL